MKKMVGLFLVCGRDEGKVMAKQYTQIEVTFVRETEMAVLVRTLHTGADDETEVWIPKSQIDEDDSASFEVGAEGTLSVTEWFLEKEGLL